MPLVPCWEIAHAVAPAFHRSVVHAIRHVARPVRHVLHRHAHVLHTVASHPHLVAQLGCRFVPAAFAVGMLSLPPSDTPPPTVAPAVSVQTIQPSEAFVPAVQPMFMAGIPLADPAPSSGVPTRAPAPADSSTGQNQPLGLGGAPVPGVALPTGVPSLIAPPAPTPAPVTLVAVSGGDPPPPRGIAPGGLVLPAAIIQPVPEPASGAVLLAGFGLAIAARGRGRRRAG